MVGPTLVDIREHIESLASEGGDFALVCGRTGERPFPVAGKRFAGRETARAAARATEQYRAALRRYDPQLPYHDVIVREETGTIRGGDGDGEAEWALTGPVVTGESAEAPGGALVEFCHDVAAAVFETLSEQGADDVETAVMDTYLELAEEVTDPDRLCLCLVESMATELETHLEPAGQAAVLASAADRLSPTAAADEPVSATFAWLRRLGLVTDYASTPATIDLGARRRSVAVDLEGYALPVRDGRLPTLPVVVDLYRRSPRWPPARVRAVEEGDGWRLTIVLARETDPAGLATVPIRAD